MLIYFLKNIFLNNYSYSIQSQRAAKKHHGDESTSATEANNSSSKQMEPGELSPDEEADAAALARLRASTAASAVDGDAEVAFCSIKADEVPPVPANKYLMRRTVTASAASAGGASTESDANAGGKSRHAANSRDRATDDDSRGRRRRDDTSRDRQATRRQRDDD